MLSKRLATIVQDAPVDINVEDCCYELRYSGDLHAFMEELGFYSIIEKLGFKGRRPAAKAASDRKTVIDINTEEELKKMADTLSKAGKTAILVRTGILPWPMMTVSCTE